MKKKQIFINTDIQDLIDFLYNSEANFSKVFILVDENTNELCLPVLNDLLLTKSELIEIIEIEAGEEQKSLETAQLIIETLLEYEADKNAVLINVGGGVICDLGGFVASVYKRGIPFINIPTTLLAMVDASVGGKTGLNVSNFKNQIGTFNPADAVFIYNDFLKTLPPKQIKSGFAEIAKYCLIDDLAYWELIKDLHFDAINDWTEWVNLSLTIKTEIVSDDPNEKGKRKILNFGHTIGHAFESLSLLLDKNPISHGEAVAFGMLCELYISHKVLEFPIDRLNEVRHFVKRNFGKFDFKSTDFETLLVFIRGDKKNENGLIYPILLKNIGQPMHQVAVDESLILDSFKYYLAVNE